MTVPARHRFDVVVVGYGYAGAMAAIGAADSGASVLLLEKAPTPGGISICSAGGLRTATDANAAFQYLQSTCGGKTPDTILRVFAEGMTGLADKLASLAQLSDAQIDHRANAGNYPFPGNETFGFSYVEEIKGFDPTRAYPQVRGSPQGAFLFKVLSDNVAARAEQIEVALDCSARRLVKKAGSITGVELRDGTRIHADRGVILACGGFEGNRDMQAQFWPGGAALNAAYRFNTGDGIKMAQDVGASLWHMWHYHGSYGYQVPDQDYPFGVRVKRLPDWQPSPANKNAQNRDLEDVPRMAWILLDQTGSRFMNEYEPYVQDTGARALGTLDPLTQTMPANPAFLVFDEVGRSLYPLGKPTRNDAAANYEWSPDNQSEIENGLFRRAEDLAALAGLIDVDPERLKDSIAIWNQACERGTDTAFGRPQGSLQPIDTPPYYVADVFPIVSNTQGGPRHDAEQRILDAFGEPIPGLFAAGECGSLFGHIYLSGGNLAECFIGGEIAGRNAALGWRDRQRRRA